jgi:hypothetical protein
MKAEESEAKAKRRAEQILEAERRTLEIRWAAQSSFWKDRNFVRELDVIVAKARTTDPVWKGHVSDNQWFMQKAVMYGTAANNELLERLVNALTAPRQIHSNG